MGLRSDNQMCVSQLKNEFRNNLARQTDLFMGAMSQLSLTSDSSSWELREVCYMTYNKVHKEAIYDLRRIAERMNSEGYIGECLEVYKGVRKPFVDSVFKRLEIEKLDTGGVRVFVWQELKMKIQWWIRAAEFCIRILFTLERQLARRIFEGLGATSTTYDECFIDTTKAAAMNLLNFAEAVSTSRRSPFKLFKILDLYHALLNLLPDINVLFGLESAKSIRTNAALILSFLEEAARAILSNFENELVFEMSTLSSDKGTTHKITTYVTKYIDQILGYNNSLTGLIVSKPPTCFGGVMVPDLEFTQVEGPTPLALHVILIIVVLQFKLEAKSKYYTDASLGHLFIANNVHYIVQHIKGSSKLQEMIGEDYMNKLNEQAVIRYQSSTCDRLIHILRPNARWCSFPWVSKSTLKHRINTFNDTFNEFRLNQARWEVPDMQLRVDLRLSLIQKLTPTYMSFLHQFKSRVETYVKFSVEDLQNLIMDHFFVYDIIRDA